MNHPKYLCRDCVFLMQRADFREWFTKKYSEVMNLYCGDYEAAVRAQLGIASRKEIDNDPAAQKRYLGFRQQFISERARAA